jgi:hypothetical protein
MFDAVFKYVGVPGYRALVVCDRTFAARNMLESARAYTDAPARESWLAGASCNERTWSLEWPNGAAVQFMPQAQIELRISGAEYQTVVLWFVRNRTMSYQAFRERELQIRARHRRAVEGSLAAVPLTFLTVN